MDKRKAIEENLQSIKQSMFLLDWDGVGVPVLQDKDGQSVLPREVVTTIEFRNAFFDFIEQNPESVAILTGRALREELFYCLSAQSYPGGLDAILKDGKDLFLQRIEQALQQTKFKGGLARFVRLLNDVPIMTAHGYDLFHKGDVYKIPLPAGEELPSRYARIAGVVFEETRQLILAASPDDPLLSHPKTPALRSVFKYLLSRIQPDRWNLNFKDVPPEYKPRIIDATGRLMVSVSKDYYQPASALIQSFIAEICDIVGHSVIDLAASLKCEDKDYKLPQGDYRALKLGGDPSDGTYLEVKGSSDKGKNLIYWLKHLDLIHKPIIAVSDQLQLLSEPGGDRLLAEALLSIMPGRFTLWQTLDGGEKHVLADDDKLRPYLSWVFPTCYDFHEFFIQMGSAKGWHQWIEQLYSGDQCQFKANSISNFENNSALNP